MQELPQSVTLAVALMTAAGLTTVLVRRWPSKPEPPDTTAEDRRNLEAFKTEVRKQIEDLRDCVRKLEDANGISKETATRHASRLSKIESRLDTLEKNSGTTIASVERVHWNERLMRLERIVGDRGD